MRPTRTHLLNVSRVVLALFLVSGAGCAGSAPDVRTDPEDWLAVGKRAFERGKYTRAIADLEGLTLNHPGSAEAQEAQYLLGECYRLSKQYDLARDAYRDLISTYPQSGFRDDAQLKIGISYFEESLPPELDQELTFMAGEEFEVFLADYATSPLAEEAESWLRACREKIAEKCYLNGRLYLRMGHAQAARLTFEDVLSRFPSSKWVAPSILGVGRAHLREGNQEEAEAALARLIEEYPNTPEAVMGREALKELEEASDPGR